MDKIKCELCGEEIHSVELHLKKEHPGTSLSEYALRFPNARLLSDRAQAIVDAETAKKAQPITVDHAQTADVIQMPAQKSTNAVATKQSMTKVFSLPTPVLNSRGTELEINVMSPPKELEDFIPAIDKGHVWNVDDLTMMAMALELNMPLYLYGHKGTGKTTNFEQLAACTRRPMIRIQHSLGTEESHIVGQWTARGGETIFELGPLALAMRHGWIYLADEYDVALPSILAVYQAVLEGKSLVIKEADLANRIIKPHPNFRFWANGNTNGSGDETGLYAGTNVQNSANYDRFQMMLEIKYMPEPQEAKIVINRTGINPKDADKLVKLASDIRKSFDAGKLNDTISTRALVSIANIGLRKADMKTGIRLCFTNKLNKVDRQVVDSLAQRIYG